MTQLPAIYQQLGDDSDALTAGLSGSFGIISIRSGRFRVKYQGGEHPLLDANQNPLASLDVVIVRANAALSKTFYRNGYQDGSDEAPDCSSSNGVTPDSHIQAPIAAECARCPNNVFGSRITPSGSKVKACADVRRLAVVPASDMANEAFGGPMLLRIPAASLGNLADYSRSLRQRGLNSRAVVTRISFDLDASYPKLMFRPARMVEEGEIPLVLAAAQNPVVETIISAGQVDSPPQVAAPRPAVPAPAISHIPASPVPQVMPRPVPQPVQVQAPVPQPVQPKPFFADPAPAAAAPQPQGEQFFAETPVAAAQAVAKKRGRPRRAEEQLGLPIPSPAPAPAQAVPAAPAAPASNPAAEAQLEKDIQALLATLD